jgi:hypothetical protein
MLLPLSMPHVSSIVYASCFLHCLCLMLQLPPLSMPHASSIVYASCFSFLHCLCLMLQLPPLSMPHASASSIVYVLKLPNASSNVSKGDAMLSVR